MIQSNKDGNIVVHDPTKIMNRWFDEFIQLSLNNDEFPIEVYIYVKYMFERAWTKLEISVVEFVIKFPV